MTNEFQPTQRFTGYWIPAELSNLGLSKIEQFLLAMIDSLESPAPDYCFASNKYLAEHMELSESRVSFYITNLKRMGLIEQVGNDGRRRVLRTLKENWYKRKEEFSKKELCVKSRSQGAWNREVRVRESTLHIEKSNNIDDLPPQVPKKEPPIPKKKQHKEEEEKKAVYKVLNETILNQAQKERLSKEYTEEQVTKAIFISKKHKIKKSLMGMILNILENPQDWDSESDNPNKTMALKYNDNLRKVNAQIAKKNEKLIESNVLIIISHSGIEQVSLNSSYFENDIINAERYLEKLKEKTKPHKENDRP